MCKDHLKIKENTVLYTLSNGEFSVKGEKNLICNKLKGR